MNNEEANKVHEVIGVLDKALGEAECGVVDALNAVSVMSTSLAHSIGLTQKEYMDHMTHMFDSTDPQKKVIAQEENTNE